MVGTFDSIRVDIVVSEAGDKKTKTKFTKKVGNSTGTKLGNDTPSFLCEKVGIELEVLKMTDGTIDRAKQNVIYMSRRQMKKHTSTVINFSLNIRFISQQVCIWDLIFFVRFLLFYENNFYFKGKYAIVKTSSSDYEHVSKCKRCTEWITWSTRFNKKDIKYQRWMQHW